MLKKLMSLATLLILVGVFVLSAPVLAGNSAQPGKATTQTTTGKPAVVQTSPSKAAASMQPSSTRSIFVGAFRYYLRDWLGLPDIHIVDPKPSLPGEPQKSSTDPNNHSGLKYEIAPIRDNGGHDID
ncbi:MAG: hypothetical protein NT028_10510 [candidate division Zixibacteria bacterium]|nr:hypothetical protein [candidate division Zixibacteria bacterium]